MLVVSIDREVIHYNGGGLKGNIDRKPNEKPDLGALRPAVGRCSVMLTADGSVAYQEIITVMDGLLALGFADIALGQPGDTPEPPKPRSVPPLDPAKASWTTDASGRRVLELHPAATDAARKEALKQAPVVIVTKTSVMFDRKDIAKPDDPALATKLGAALPKDPADPTLILQADAETPAAAINAIISVAQKQGYTNLLFAVKNK